MHDKVEHFDSLALPSRVRRQAVAGVSRAAAFTLTELLVVMGIVVILLAVGVPAVKALMNSGTADTAINAVSAVAANARAHATRGKTLLRTEYKGSAMIAWPILNDDGEVSGVELRVADHVQPDGSTEKNLYQNLEGLESVRLPNDSGVAAITRQGTGDAVLQSPPFAVRFDDSGHLISRGTNNEHAVDYDGNGDDDYDDRSWPGATDARNMRTVLALMVYSNKGLTAAGNDLPDPGTNLSGSAATWIQENGQPVFFNRYSGAIMEEQ